ncbi:unnamed protein product [Chrysodeixis includens]|uniref:Uncharacterized protein n=1 Tax=Chrysodeixis includens TaxID=689277 RepID=A0A9N8L511_CHRIL|nr:unnamed protein product [Chrysodeixis includens]
MCENFDIITNYKQVTACTSEIHNLKIVINGQPLMLDINVHGYRVRGRSKKRWMDCVKDDIPAKSVTCQMTSDRNVWKKKTCRADPK